jgi:UDP-N-acetylglucosamine 4,6-dehydratase/5-epimerase
MTRKPSAASADDLAGKSVLVTGGTGSFGRAFVRHLLAGSPPARLVVFSRDELKQFEMQSEFPTSRHPCMRYFLGDVRDRDRLAMAFHGVDTVVHAAALKQVPAAEYNPFECIQTNVHGAENVVQAALSAGVARVIALSTDKAANPINLYGASKLASDKIFVAANNLSAGRTRFSVVRYGNVIGSRGSVVPFFRKLVESGATELPVTDPRMTRFWITLDEGVAFVVSVLKSMRGGEIFVPKIASMTIGDLANAIAPHLPHRIVGVRPGEKLHEVMITEDDARNTVELADRYVIEPDLEFWPSFGDPHVAAGGRRVPDRFRYASDTNPLRFGPEDLRRILART